MDSEEVSDFILTSCHVWQNCNYFAGDEEVFIDDEKNWR